LTQGTWQTITRKAAAAAGTAGDEGPPGLAAAASKSGKGSLLAHLGALTQERNLWAHGSGPRTTFDASQRVARLFPLLEAALGKVTFLANWSWALTVSSSYQIRSQTFNVTARNAMSDHPEFERRALTSSEPVADGRLYVVFDGRPRIDLTPFVVERVCDVCEHSELFYSDKLGRGSSLVLKSFGRGHPMADQTLGDDVQLLGRPPGAH
jgi:hypothetical protein